MCSLRALLPTFIEMPAFQRHRAEYLDDDDYQQLQKLLIANPEAGAMIRNSSGLRKLRFEDPRRGKGKRGGLRIIYYFWLGGHEFWLFTLYSKNEVADLTARQCKLLSVMLNNELSARKCHLSDEASPYEKT